VLPDIAKASPSTDSFISAGSFQESTRLLREAPIVGERDGCCVAYKSSTAGAVFVVLSHRRTVATSNLKRTVVSTLSELSALVKKRKGREIAPQVSKLLT
jgi:hypothetical protein